MKDFNENYDGLAEQLKDMTWDKRDDDIIIDIAKGRAKVITKNQSCNRCYQNYISDSNLYYFLDYDLFMCEGCVEELLKEQ